MNDKEKRLYAGARGGGKTATWFKSVFGIDLPGQPQPCPDGDHAHCLGCGETLTVQWCGQAVEDLKYCDECLRMYQ